MTIHCPECKSPVTADDVRCAVCGFDPLLERQPDDDGDCDFDYDWEQNDA